MIILFGLAGSGKGTQGNALAELFGWRWCSNGELIRQAGIYDDIINKGGLIPDDDVNRLMAAQIERADADGFNMILDGYPRTLPQADYLMQHFANEVEAAIILDVPKEELFQRLALRGRDDDKEKSAIEERWRIFEQNICSILPLLESKNIPVVHVDGTGEVDAVTARLVSVVKKLVPSAQIQEKDVNNPGEPERAYGD